MVKHVTIIDKDEFLTLGSLINNLKYETNQMEDSYRKNQLNRYINEIKEILGLTIVLPEVMTAEWRISMDDTPQTRCTCSRCGYTMRTIGKFDILSHLPGECPGCKAVMINVK